MVVRKRTINLATPRIVGILNATPDSFSDGGQFNDVENAIERIGLMIEQGASIIDVGGESTRPGSDPVSEEVELNRVMPILERAVPRFADTFFSIDTTKLRVARAALEAGVHFINDISGLRREPELAGLCARYSSGYILMHSQGDPKTMQQDPKYGDLLTEIYTYFEKRIALAKGKGVETIIIDPGIGFGKTIEHNLKILANLDYFTTMGYPIMVGVSRKSMLGELLNNRPVEDRVIGSVAAHYDALMKGAKLLRVHDVKEASDSILVYNAISEHRKSE